MIAYIIRVAAYALGICAHVYVLARRGWDDIGGIFAVALAWPVTAPCTLLEWMVELGQRHRK